MSTIIRRGFFLWLLLNLTGFWFSPIRADKAGITAEKDSWVKKNGIQVICYHQIQDDKYIKKSNSFVLPLSKFKEQINWLKTEGYQTITLAQFQAASRGELAGLPAKPIVISFDDGRVSFSNLAQEILDKAGFHAVLFVYPGVIDLKDPKHSSWDQLKKAMEKGHEIHSHTYTHPYLDRLADRDQEKELKKSKGLIELRLKNPVTCLAFPFGTFNAKSPELLEKNGYQASFTVFLGSNFPGGSPWFHSRYLVLAEHSLDDFRNRLSLRSLQLQDLNPPNGSKIRLRQLVRMKIPAGLEKGRLRVEFGGNFIGHNKEINFLYNKETGELSLQAEIRARHYLIGTVYYFQDQDNFQSSFMYLARGSE